MSDEKPCESCEGSGTVWDGDEFVACPACSGSGVEGDADASD